MGNNIMMWKVCSVFPGAKVRAIRLNDGLNNKLMYSISDLALAAGLSEGLSTADALATYRERAIAVKEKFAVVEHKVSAKTWEDLRKDATNPLLKGKVKALYIPIVQATTTNLISKDDAAVAFSSLRAVNLEVVQSWGDLNIDLLDDIKK